MPCGSLEPSLRAIFGRWECYPFYIKLSVTSAVVQVLALIGPSCLATHYHQSAHVCKPDALEAATRLASVRAKH